jgi:hypothetical protein
VKLRIEQAGYPHWLEISNAMPRFDDLVSDLRQQAPHATYREETERRVIWRQHLGVVFCNALALDRIVTELGNPDDQWPLQMGLSVLTILLTIGGGIWTYWRPSHSKPTLI